MVNSRVFSGIIRTGLLILLIFATVISASEIKIINGSDLLRVIREKAGRTDTDAYEQRTKQLQPAPKTEPNLIDEQPIKPVIDLQIEEKITAPKPLITEIPSKPITTQPADKLLSMIPADSLFCLRVNHFERTLGLLDKFTEEASPVPMGISMMVRMQLAQILGNPELAGLNMRGNLMIFAQAEPGSSTQAEHEPEMFFCGLAAVTNYKKFIGNPTFTEADAKGVSTLTSQAMPPLLVKRVGRFAAISTTDNYDKLLAFTESASNGSRKSLADTLDYSDIKAAKNNQLWFYCNMQLASQAFGQDVSQQLAQAQMMVGAMSGGPPGQEQGQDQSNPLAMMQGMDFDKLFKEIQSFSITVRLKPNSLSITKTVTAVPETETARLLSADSKIFTFLLPMLGAVTPENMDNELKKNALLIPMAKEADFVGTFNLLNSLKTMMPQMDIQAKSSIAYAIKFGPDKLTAQIAIPKEHLAELIKAQGMAQQQMPLEMKMQQQQMIEQMQQKKEQKNKRRTRREPTKERKRERKRKPKGKSDIERRLDLSQSTRGLL